MAPGVTSSVILVATLIADPARERLTKATLPSGQRQRGANDLAMLIARPQRRLPLDPGDLTALLYVQGIKRKELVEG